MKPLIESSLEKLDNFTSQNKDAVQQMKGAIEEAKYSDEKIDVQFSNRIDHIKNFEKYQCANSNLFLQTT